MTLRLLALGDVARVDHHAIDQRIIERGDIGRLEPTISRRPYAERGTDEKTGRFRRRQLLKFRAHRARIVGVHMRRKIEIEMPLLRRIAEGVLHAAADILQPPVRGGDRNDVLRIVSVSCPQATLASRPAGSGASAARSPRSRERPTPRCRGVLERLHVDLEEAERRARQREFYRVIMVVTALQCAKVYLVRQRVGGRQASARK